MSGIHHHIAAYRTPAIRRLVARLSALLVCFFALSNTASASHAAVFILHSYGEEYPWTKRQHRAFIEELSTHPGIAFSTSVESLDTKRVHYDAAYAGAFASYLATKYAGYAPQLIYVTDDNALRFARVYLARLFPDVPVFFSGINNYRALQDRDPKRETGVFERKEITPNLALLDLFAQGMRDITVVGDASETYHAIRIEIERELVNFPAIKANYVSSGKIDEITAQLRELKNGPLFLTTLGAVSDAHGRTLELSETVSAIVSAGSFMVFSMEDTYLYPGVLGGYVTSGAKQGRGAAMLVEKFLAGTRLGEIAPIEISPNEYLFDDGELDAAGLTLPANIAVQASFVNRQPSFYETHRSAILTSLYVMAVLFVSSLVVYLLVVARKNHHIAAQARALLEVKDSLTRAQHIARMGNWDWHITQDRLYWSDGIYRLFGVDRATHQPSY